MRESINEEVVSEYCQALLNGAQFPPVVLFNDGKSYYIGDGWTRIFAHKKAGFEIINADVRMGSYDDALDYALGKANSGHGQRYTNADKRKKVLKAVYQDRYKDLSSRKLADVCDVSHEFVAKVRNETGTKPNAVKTIQNGKEVLMLDTKDQFKKDEHEDPIEENVVISELSQTVQDLAEENKKLEARVAVAAMEATDEEKASAQNIISELQDQIKTLEADNRVLKASRDSFQAEASEAKKQALYGKRRYEKAEKEIEELRKKLADVKMKLDFAEADLAIR
jgi:chromosome segregation ATPase